LILISCRKDLSDSRAFAGANAIRNSQFLPRLDSFIELDEGSLAD
jgi:hypothetical protein